MAYWVVMLTNNAFQSVRTSLSDAASVGTLEQLYLSPFPFWWIAFGRVLSNFLYSLAVYVPFLLLLMLTTGRWLHIDVVSILPLVAFAVAQGYGIGLVMSGIALIHKRVSVFGQVVTMFFAVAIAASPDLSPLVQLLPLNMVWRLLRNVMVDAVPLWHLAMSDLALVVLKTALLVGLGWGIYRWCERIAKQQALLGQY